MRGRSEYSRRLAAENPAKPEYQQLLAAAHLDLGNLYQETGRGPGDYRTTFRRALAIRQELTRDHPEIGVYREELAMIRNNLGALHFRRGRLADAETMYRQAVRDGEQLVRDHPDIAMYRQGLGYSQLNLGNVYRDTGRLLEAQGDSQAGLGDQGSPG